MDRGELARLLRDVREGTVAIDDAVEKLSALETGDLGFARIDHHRSVRRGMPEVVFGESKTAEQILAIVAHHVERRSIVLVSRVAPAAGEALRHRYPEGRYDPLSRTFLLDPARETRPPGRPGLLIVSAGTADIPVAEEAAIAAEVFGLAPERLFDVGVAGLHRLLEEHDRLRRAHVVIVVAGMEGALPSVIAGLVRSPVIGVPTSVGYGVARGGKAALYGMLASCAGGLTVVNIDNGIGAAAAARTILSITAPD